MEAYIYATEKYMYVRQRLVAYIEGRSFFHQNKYSEASQPPISVCVETAYFFL